jgi:hypothetical protein
MFPSPSLGPPLLSASPSPPLPCGIPPWDEVVVVVCGGGGGGGGGAAWVVVGGGGGGAVVVVVIGAAVVVGGAVVVVVGAGAGFGCCLWTGRLCFSGAFFTTG